MEVPLVVSEADWQDFYVDRISWGHTTSPADAAESWLSFASDMFNKFKFVRSQYTLYILHKTKAQRKQATGNCVKFVAVFLLRNVPFHKGIEGTYNPTIEAGPNNSSFGAKSGRRRTQKNGLSGTKAGQFSQFKKVQTQICSVNRQKI